MPQLGETAARDSERRLFTSVASVGYEKLLCRDSERGPANIARTPAPLKTAAPENCVAMRPCAAATLRGSFAPSADLGPRPSSAGAFNDALAAGPRERAPHRISAGAAASTSRPRTHTQGRARGGGYPLERFTRQLGVHDTVYTTVYN